MKKRGKFIVIEGIDGAGKSTQFDFLIARLQTRGISPREISFPRHGDPAAHCVGRYLSGEYGSQKEVGPRRASHLYALDRYDASFQLREWLEAGDCVIADRYLVSNIAHQGGQFETDREREEYVSWLYELEYETFDIPKPDINLVFMLPVEIAQRRCRERGNRDLHEADPDHVLRAHRAYAWAAQMYPDEFELVDGVHEGRELTEGEVHERVWTIVERMVLPQ